MPFQVLAITAPGGSQIRSKKKTIEVRTWAPVSLPLLDLVIVQHENPLMDEDAEDSAGRVVAMVDVLGVRDWTTEDLPRSGMMEFFEGKKAWELTNIRPMAYEKFVPARQGIYVLDLIPKHTLYPEGFVPAGSDEETEAAEESDTPADPAKEG